MINKIIFLIESPYNARDHHRFGIEILRNRGFSVEIWDVRAITKPHTIGGYAPPDAFEDANLLLIKNRQDFFSEMRSQVPAHSIFINQLGLNFKSLALFREIKKRKIRQIQTFTGCLPVPQVSVFHKLRAYRLSILPIKILERIILKVLKKKYQSPSQTYYVLGGNKSARNYSICTLNNHKNVIHAHAYDYDRVLEDLDPMKSCEYAVFLDTYFPYHSDNLLLNMKYEITPDPYYSKLRRYFDYFEKTYGVPVKITAHPRSDYSDKVGIYGDRDIIFGETQSLVKNSKIVMLDVSTAINYAVIYKKPVICIRFDCMKNGLNKKYPSTFAKILNCKSVVTADNEDTYFLNHDVFNVDEQAYKNYKFDYIKTEGTEEKLGVDIMADFIETIA